MSLGRLALALGLVSSLCSCAAAPRVVKESSSARRPDWIARPPQDVQQVYFVGLCSGADSLEAGQQAAVQDALSKISHFIGSAVETRSSSYLDEVRQNITQQINSRSAAKVQGYALLDWYYEKLTRVDPAFSLTKYDVYALVRYDRNEAEKERQRQSLKRQSAASLALRRYDAAQTASARGQTWRAAALYTQAASLLRGIDEPMALQGTRYSSTVDLSAAVKEGFDRASAAMRLYVYDVKVAGPPEAAQAFRASLVGALSKGGYALSDRSATLRMCGDISLIKGQVLLDNQVYSVQGQISASQAGSGDAVASVEVQAKGLHANPLDAALNAARDAAAQGGAELSAALSSARSKYLEEYAQESD